MATHSNILAWEIPRAEEAGGLQSTGSQRVGHNWAAECLPPYHSHGGPEIEFWKEFFMKGLCVEVPGAASRAFW